MSHHRLRPWFWVTPLILLTVFRLGGATATATTNALVKLTNADCLDCHTDPSNTRSVNGYSVPLKLFPTNSFPKSVHGSLDCIDCHDGVK